MISPFHLAIAVTETSQVGEARRAAVRIAHDLGHDEVAAGRVAIIATELGNNLVRHARGGGVLLLAAAEDDDGCEVVELLSVDHGPGIANVAHSMADGHSTGGTPGNGLGAVRRLSDAGFDLFTSVPEGTVILSRIGSGGNVARQALQRSTIAAGIAIAMPGEQVCGDAWRVRHDERGAMALMADGLGHGPHAAEASQAALQVLAGLKSDAVPGEVLDKIHARLRSTRGAAVALGRFDSAAGTLLFTGAGNIAGRLLSGIEDRSLLSQHGTAGLQMRRVQEQRYAWPAHGMLVLHSDGLKTRWDLKSTPGILQHHPAVIAAWLWRTHQRGRDDASVMVLKRRSG
jgi:anti-sigma regulatory factor (Ser/Thr protein kinase)